MEMGARKNKDMNKLPDEVLKVLCEAYREMNIINARDGAPGDVSQPYWDDIMHRLDEIVRKDSGNGAWLNPILFKK